MDQIFVKDLLARGVIGISEQERSQPQDILINLTISTDFTKAAQSDNIDDCVNYRTLAKKVLAYVESADRHTVEALAVNIAKLCLEDSAVISVKVRVEKPGAVRFSHSVGAEVERSRPA